MFAKLIILLILFSFSGCASNDPWRRQDTMMQIGVTAVMLGDAITTEKIQYQANTWEAGPIAKRFLGPQPSTSDTCWYFGSAIISSWGIAWLLPAKWRPYYQGWEIAVHGYAVDNNCQNGLC